MKARIILYVCRDVEFLTRGSRQLCAAALVQFLVRGVVQEGPYAAKWNSLLVVLDNGARAAALVQFLGIRVNIYYTPCTRRYNIYGVT